MLALTALLSFALVGCSSGGEAGEEAAGGGSAAPNANFTLVAPAEGSTVTSPFQLEGSTTLEAEQVDIRVLDANGEEVVSSYAEVDADGNFSHPSLMFFMGKGDAGMIELSAGEEVGTYAVELE